MSLHKKAELSDILQQISSTLGSCPTDVQFCVLMWEQREDSSQFTKMCCPFSARDWPGSKLSPDKGFQHVEDLII